MTTGAQAEGAIEGVHTDYKLHADEDGRNVWIHAFKFSRYKYPKRTKESIEDVAKPQQRTAFTTEWDGTKNEL